MAEKIAISTTYSPRPLLVSSMKLQKPYLLPQVLATAYSVVPPAPTLEHMREPPLPQIHRIIWKLKMQQVTAQAEPSAAGCQGITKSPITRPFHGGTNTPTGSYQDTDGSVDSLNGWRKNSAPQQTEGSQSRTESGPSECLGANDGHLTMRRSRDQPAIESPTLLWR